MKVLTPRTLEKFDTDKINEQISRLKILESRAKNRENTAKSRLKKLQQTKTLIENPEQYADILPFVDPEPVKHHEEIIFKPNDGPQSLFLSASEREILYGGAAGSGKTIGIIADALRDTSNGNYKALIIRRTNDELREIINKTQEFYLKAFPSARWSEKKSEWSFPSGAKIWLTYLEHDRDIFRYQGQAFTYIAFDELTQYPTPYAWDYLRSRLRTADPDLRIYSRATTNPGGPGHQWVKRMFIDPAVWGEAFWATDIESGEILRWPPGSKYEGQPLFKRRFIPGRLKDNPFLDADGRYEANLLSLPEYQRKQLLEGSWDILEGAAFGEFNRNIHVIPYKEIPKHWKRFRAADYGYSSWASCLWMACSPDGQIIVYRELYVTKNTAEQFADKILEAERNENIAYGVLDSSVFHQRGDSGPPLAEVMIRRGCIWKPSDRSKGSRIAGKNEIHRRLAVNEFSKKPGLVFMDTCRNLIAHFPMLQLDKNNPEDVSSTGADHDFDSLRYGLMSRPMPNQGDYVLMNQPLRNEFKPADANFGY